MAPGSREWSYGGETRAGTGGQREPALFGAQSCHVPVSHETSLRSGFYFREPGRNLCFRNLGFYSLL